MSTERSEGLGLLALSRLAWRIPAMVIWILVGFFVALVLVRLLPPAGRRFSVRHFAKGILFICGVRLRVRDLPPLASPCLVVSNHVSWLDIYVLHAIEPMTFIAKSQIRDWPVIGWLVTAAGTLYIERGRRHAVHDVMQAAQHRFDRGERIAFFPEGTTTDGTSLLKFHANLFSLAERRPDLPIAAISIRYRQHGNPTQIPAYVGDMTLVGSMLQIARSPGLSVEPLIHQPFRLSDRPDANRRTLSAQTYGLIASGLGLSPLPPAGRSHDRPDEQP